MLDEEGEPVPQGQEGELYVGGLNLALGYINPVLTDSRFLPCPFAKEGHVDPRMYRTGDVARVLPNGYLEIRGRSNNMQKIRGYSVELGAVEAALEDHPAVLQAACKVMGVELSRKVCFLSLTRTRPHSHSRSF